MDTECTHKIGQFNLLPYAFYECRQIIIEACQFPGVTSSKSAVRRTEYRYLKANTIFIKKTLWKGAIVFFFISIIIYFLQFSCRNIPADIFEICQPAKIID